jgi:hypothetical protein
VTATITTEDLVLLAEHRRRASVAQSAPPAPRFRGAAAEAQDCHARAFLLAGPAETGKTFAGLWRLDSEARAHPDQYILARKVRATMDSTVLNTWRRIIAIRGGVEVFGGERPQFYQYPNGARVWVVGFDNPDKILSGEFGGAYVNQAEELDEADWETLSTRVTGRGASNPHPATWGDCNPGAEDHWIKQREQAGTLKLLESKHEDNPTLYGDDGAITAQGERSMAVLDGLTGVRYWRLRRGLWVGAEGQHFEAWDEAVHVIDPQPVTGDWVIWASLDYGFGHPLAFGVFGLDPAGDTHLMAEWGGRKTLIPDHVTGVLGQLQRLGLRPERVRHVSAGHDAWATRGGDDAEAIADKWAKAVRAQVGYDALPLVRAVVDRVNGAQAIQEGLGLPQGDPARNQGPRRPSLYVWRGCTETIRTMPRMVTDPRNPEDVKKINADAQGRGGDDCFIAGTMITTARGDIPIEHIASGDMLLTRGGYRPVVAVWNSRRNADVVTATLSNGVTLTATPNHRIWTPQNGWKRIDTLRYGDIISLCQKKQKPLFSMGYRFGVIPTRDTQTIASITRLVASISSRVLATFTLRFGSQYTAPFLMDVISTIRTAIRSIMTSPIWNALPMPITTKSIAPMAVSAQLSPFRTLESERGFLLALLTGIAQRRVEPGIESMENELIRLANQFDTLVSNAVLNLSQRSSLTPDFAHLSAKQSGDVMPGLITSISHASSAGSCSPATSTTSCDSAPVYVLGIAGTGKADTYAIHVAEHHEYYANGVLVKNCYDMLRYGVMGRPAPARPSGLAQGRAKDARTR